MHVAHGTVHRTGGHILQPDVARQHQVARRVGQDFGIASAIDQGWEPADFQLRAALDQQIGFVEQADKTRPGIDEMRILRPLGNGGDSDLVAADFLGDRPKIRQRGHDIQLGLDHHRPGEEQ